MEIKTIKFNADSHGMSYQLSILEFHSQIGTPRPKKIYLQSALHADELPGALVLHYLAQELRAAEADSLIEGSIVLVTLANPVGLAQRIINRNEGRFSLSTATNFNRNFPLLNPTDGPVQMQAQALADDPQSPVVERLKATLLAMALDADIVLDLHADSEAIAYVYLPEALWPAAKELPDCLESEAVILWQPSGDTAFEEATAYPFLSTGPGKWPSLISTIELRGLADVSSETAKNDARRLINFLNKKGFVRQQQKQTATPDASFLLTGTPTPICNVELIKAPEGGIVVYHVQPGDRVAKNDNLITLVTNPGLPDGEIQLKAPQNGVVLSQYRDRYAQRGDTLLKLLGEQHNISGRKGLLDK